MLTIVEPSARTQIVEVFMSTTVRTALIIVGLALIGVPAVLANPIAGSVRDAATLGSSVEQVQYWGGRCERLRRACIYKEERGEVGEGNCRRYRQECLGNSYCERLRRACVYKYERDEVGEGNCRRYRRECLR